MAKDQGANLMAQRRKASSGEGADVRARPHRNDLPWPPLRRPRKRVTSPGQFWNEVRAEGRKDHLDLVEGDVDHVRHGR